MKSKIGIISSKEAQDLARKKENSICMLEKKGKKRARCGKRKSVPVTNAPII